MGRPPGACRHNDAASGTRRNGDWGPDRARHLSPRRSISPILAYRACSTRHSPQCERPQAGSQFPALQRTRIRALPPVISPANRNTGKAGCKTVLPLVSRANFVSITSYDQAPKLLGFSTRRRMSARPRQPLVSSAPCTMTGAPARMAAAVCSTEFDSMSPPATKVTSTSRDDSAVPAMIFSGTTARFRPRCRVRRRRRRHGSRTRRRPWPWHGGSVPR